MPNDQFGRPVLIGDTVTLTGEVTKVLDDPNFVNCTVKLQQPMPPSGTYVIIEVNTVQLVKAGGTGEAKGAPVHPPQAGGAAEAKGGPAHPPQPSHGTAAKK